MLTVCSLVSDIAQGKISPEEVFTLCKKTIDEKNPKLNALLSYRKECPKYKKNQPLTGIPYASKGIILCRDMETNAGSLLLKGYVPQENAEVNEKLEEAGAMCLGQANLDEFAQGSSNEYSAYGPARNPYNEDYVPGGSSGGSAVAVASGMVPFALGTDTGGSIRQPASFCGVVGMKMSYGRISRSGVMSYASSLDTVGLFTNTVEDIAYILPHISGPSSKDMTTMKEPFPSFEVFQKKREIFSLKNKNIGYITECMENPALDPEIQESLFSFYKKLEKEGANIVPVSFPEISYANPAYFVLAKSEGSSNYARYDGVRYGHHSKKAQNQEEGFSLSRAEGFGDEVRRCIMLGTYMLSSGEYDKYFKKAAQVRALISKRFQVLFSSCDILLSPVSPFFPFKIGEKIDDPVALYASDQFTTPASLAGIPALSLPISMKKGFPVSLQIMAPFGEDMRTLLYGDRFSHRIIM